MVSNMDVGCIIFPMAHKSRASGQRASEFSGLKVNPKSIHKWDPILPQDLKSLKVKIEVKIIKLPKISEPPQNHNEVLGRMNRSI